MTITIYSKTNCVYCTKAKALLKEDFNGYAKKLIEDIGKPVRTMPQIKVDGKLIGGYNQLVEHFADKKKVNFKGEIIGE